MINEKVQGSVATYLRCDWLSNDRLPTKFIAVLAGERIFEIGQRLAKLRKEFDCLICPVRLMVNVLLKDEELARDLVRDKRKLLVSVFR